MWEQQWMALTQIINTVKTCLNLFKLLTSISIFIQPIHYLIHFVLIEVIMREAVNLTQSNIDLLAQGDSAHCAAFQFTNHIYI